MKQVTFNYIWDEIIIKVINAIYDDIDIEMRNKYNLQLTNLNIKKKDICEEYNNIRQTIKKHYYDTSKSENNSENRIDNHKIAACLCYSLLQHKIFKFKVLEDIPIKLFTINYELAYTVSLTFLYYMLIAQYKYDKKDNFVQKLQKQKKLVVPKTSIGHDSYHDGRINTLALNDIYNNTFDILTYSSMMYWIEFYNRQIIEGTINPKPFDFNKKD